MGARSRNAIDPRYPVKDHNGKSIGIDCAHQLSQGLFNFFKNQSMESVYGRFHRMDV